VVEQEIRKSLHVRDSQARSKPTRGMDCDRCTQGVDAVDRCLRTAGFQAKSLVSARVFTVCYSVFFTPDRAILQIRGTSKE